MKSVTKNLKHAFFRKIQVFPGLYFQCAYFEVDKHGFKLLMKKVNLNWGTRHIIIKFGYNARFH